MIRTSYALADSFDTPGRWWLPGRRDAAVPGVLRYAPDQIHLTLYGSLPGYEPRGINRADRDPMPVPTHIHGRGEVGGEFTLLGLDGDGGTNLDGETFSTRYSARYLLVGGHLGAMEEVEFDWFSFSGAFINDFTNPAQYSVKPEYEDGQVKGLTAQYLRPEALRYRIPSLEAEIAFEADVSWGSRRTTLELNTGAIVTITPDAPKKLDWYVHTVWSFCYLLTLVTDEAVGPTEIWFGIKGVVLEGHLLYRSAGKKHVRDEDPEKLLLLHSGHVHDSFPAMCQKWFTASEMMEDVIYLFKNSRQYEVTTLESRFLGLSRALEAFSRATTGSLYIAEDKYEIIQAALLVKIHDLVPKSQGDLRSSLEKKVEFGNEFSLRRRLKDLIRSLTPEAQACVCRHRDTFVEGVHQTRNFLTHYTDALRPNALRAGELMWMSERMAMLLRILLLRWLGLSEHLIVERLRNHMRLSQFILLYSEERESAVAKPSS